jgi:hypothetical protein
MSDIQLTVGKDRKIWSLCYHCIWFGFVTRDSYLLERRICLACVWI